MKRGFHALWVGMSLLVVALTGCGGPYVEGSGQQVREERQSGDFVALEVSDGIELTVVVDPNQPKQVHVTGDDNLVALMRTEASGTTLRAWFRPEDVGNWSSRNPLRVEVRMPKLQAISRSGGGTIDVSGAVVAPEFLTIAASGGGTVRVRGLDAQSFNLDMSGGGDVTVEGRATEVSCTTSGGSTVRARELSARQASIVTSGGGSLEMRVSDSLRVTASGGGELHIVGRPRVDKQDLSGGSTLTFE
jgi:FtsP/CotA-like multicopper oxidase with cupredoxin domain